MHSIPINLISFLLLCYEVVEPLAVTFRQRDIRFLYRISLPRDLLQRRSVSPNNRENALYPAIEETGSD